MIKTGRSGFDETNIIQYYDKNIHKHKNKNAENIWGIHYSFKFDKKTVKAGVSLNCDFVERERDQNDILTKIRIEKRKQSSKNNKSNHKRAKIGKIKSIWIF